MGAPATKDPLGAHSNGTAGGDNPHLMGAEGESSTPMMVNAREADPSTTAGLCTAHERAKEEAANHAPLCAQEPVTLTTAEIPQL